MNESNEKNLYSPLEFIFRIEAHEDIITSISIFPNSGNIISVGYENDKSIKIWDPNFNVLQIMENAHNTGISDVSIKDENNFATSCWEEEIKIWYKKNNENNEENKNNFILKETINSGNNNNWIAKIIYDCSGKIISCGKDKTIKIWERNNKENKYEKVTILTHSDILYSLLLLNDKNLLITSGIDGTRFWNFLNFNFIVLLDAISWANHSLQRINEDKIIVGGKKDHLMKIISVKEKAIICTIDNSFDCYGICVINEKNIFLTVGQSHNIRIYDSINFTFIKEIENAHSNEICGIERMNNTIIVSFSYDKHFCIWSIE